jgi:ATP-dependent HslUV protease ATP-binding subunit HslU
MLLEVHAKAELAAEERVIDALVGTSASAETRQKFRKMLREGALAEREIEIELSGGGGPSGMPSFEIPGMPGAQMGMVDLSEMLGKAFGGQKRKRRMSVSDSYDLLVKEEADKLLDQELVTRNAIETVEQNGIVFLDEIDKIARSEQRGGGDVSREGVQRDLLPLIEGTTVATKHGPVKTDFVLFIASGAFHTAKPSDLLPELQGRLPIRVELQALTRNDFRRILTEPEASLVTQYVALLGTEGVTLEFAEDAIDALADLAVEINRTVENIGARRLHTVLEKLLEEISFTASDRTGESIVIDAELVRTRVGELAKNADLSRFIL